MEESEEKLSINLISLIFVFMYFTPIAFIFIKDFKVFAVSAIISNLIIIPFIIRLYKKTNIMLMTSVLLHPSITLIILGIGTIFDLMILYLVAGVLYLMHLIFLVFGLMSLKKFSKSSGGTNETKK